MTVTMTQASGHSFAFAIAGEMTIYNALALKDQLLAPLGQGTQVEFDLAGVSEIDCAGLQLLLLAAHEAKARGTPLHFCGHSPAVLEVLALCNLESILGYPRES